MNDFISTMARCNSGFFIAFRLCNSVDNNVRYFVLLILYNGTHR